MNPQKTKLTFLDDKEFEKVISGIDKLNKAVSMTLGPRSRAVLMDQGFRWMINKDGVTVAKSIFLEDPIEDAGVKVVREAAQKTVDEVGDGTTVTIILAHAIIHECLKVINSGINPMALRKGLEEGMELLIKELDKLAIPIKTLEEKINIATISASGDKQLGELIAKTLTDIGKDGVLTVEESKDLETKVEKQEGMQLEHGYSHPLFINNPDRMAAIYEDIPILVSTKPIIGMSEIGPFFTQIINGKTNKLVIIAPDVSMDVMEILLQNKLRIPTPENPSPPFYSLVIKAPGVGDNQREILRDIAALTGAKCISAEAGDRFDEMAFEDLGKAERIIANKQSTVIIGQKTTSIKEAVNTRIAMIKQQMHDHDLSDFEIEKLRERLGKLTSGIAILRIGGATQIEMQEKKERAIDAVAATKAAIEEGIVPGGEVVYLMLQNQVMLGEYVDDILENTLEAPFAKLLENSGLDHNNRLLIEQSGLENAGLDVTDGIIKNMIKAGIIDPVACPKAALRNAVSVALQIITLGCVITSIEKEQK